jgi:hypothetical protein
MEAATALDERTIRPTRQRITQQICYSPDGARGAPGPCWSRHLRSANRSDRLVRIAKMARLLRMRAATCQAGTR